MFPCPCSCPCPCPCPNSEKIPTAAKSKKSIIVDTLLQTQNGIDGK
jgi:hypothetical protein